MILSVKHTADWELLIQKEQTQIKKDDKKINKSEDYNFKAGDKVILNNNSVYKYETPYIWIFYTMRCWTNGMVTLKISEMNIRYNIYHIKLYEFDKILMINIQNQSFVHIYKNYI